jgi:hypothetical protein
MRSNWQAARDGPGSFRRSCCRLMRSGMAVSLIPAAMAVFAAPSVALEQGHSSISGGREYDRGDLFLPFDPFHTSTDARPLWLRLPTVAFEASEELAREWVLSPELLGPPEAFQQAKLSPSPLDPEPMGPLQPLRIERPVVAARPAAAAPGVEDSTEGPEHTGSTIVLRRRY